MSGDNRVNHEFEVYDWLNKEYLTNAVSSYEKHKIEIIDWNIDHATGKGENFASAVFRVNISYTTENKEQKERRFIIKAAVADEKMNEVLLELNSHSRELVMYRDVITKSYELLKNIGIQIKFAPELIYSDDKVLIMEDLCVDGYKTKNTRDRFDWDDTKIILEKLALFHACTTVLFSQNPNTFKPQMKSTIGDDENPLQLIYCNLFNSSLEQIKSMSSLSAYIPSLEKIGNSLIECLQNVFSRDDSDRFRVVTHGDMWTNNLLFRSTDGDSISDFIFVDYQEGFYGSPGIDLMYLIYTSVKFDIVYNRLDEIFEIYHRVLKDTLEKLQYTGSLPTVDDIKIDFLKKIHFGIFASLAFVPVMTMENKEYSNPINYISNEKEPVEIRKIIYSDPYVTDNLPQLLKHFRELKAI